MTNFNSTEICSKVSCSDILNLLMREVQRVNATSNDIPVSNTLELEYAHSGLLSRADATWQIRSAFTIMTMQSGFALLETGCVSGKNIANIMVKNVVDVAFGGLCYWMFGYGLTFGADDDMSKSNVNVTDSTVDLSSNIWFPANSSLRNLSTLWDVSSFLGTKYFFLNVPPNNQTGSLYTHYFFHFSFASTATTIVSGAVAERMRLIPYMIFAFFNTLSYCVPAAWIWSSRKFLNQLEFYDFAGVCGVHASGGASALVAATLLGPRMNRWCRPNLYEMASPVTALTGTLMLWWSWFSFNCGSSGGVDGNLGNINAMVAINTLHGSIAGALVSIGLSMLQFSGNVNVSHVINGILGGLCSVTGCCSLITPAEALIIGAFGGVFTLFSANLVELFRIDDPVGAIAVHLGAGTWGTLATGLFGKNFHLASDVGLNHDRIHRGLFFGGGWKLLGVQALGLVMVCIWSGLTTASFLAIINRFSKIRMSPEEEKLGADLVEHGIYKQSIVDYDSTENQHWKQDSDDVTEENASKTQHNLQEGQSSENREANFGYQPSRAAIDIESESERPVYKRTMVRTKVTEPSNDAPGRRKMSLRALPYAETTTWQAPNQSLTKLKLALQKMYSKRQPRVANRVTPFATTDGGLEASPDRTILSGNGRKRVSGGKRRHEKKGETSENVNSNGSVPIWTVNGHSKKIGGNI